MNALRKALSDNGKLPRQICKHLHHRKDHTVFECNKQELLVYSLTIEDGRAQAHDGLQRALDKRDDLEVQRKKRPSVFHGAQVLASSIVGILESFSTIEGIIKSINPHVGGLLYGSIYILLKTAHNKQIHDELVSDGLGEFTSLLYQLDEYRSRHLKTERMSNYIDKVYKGITDFAQKASQYYTISVARRLWKAGIAQAKASVEKQIETVRSAIGTVEREAMAIVLKSIMRDKNIKHEKLLASLRHTLRISDISTSAIKTMETCTSVYYPGLFASTSLRGRTIFLQEASTGLLSSADLASFEAPGQSSLLLLTGTNRYRYGAGESLCWLSPIALDVARKATGPLAFHSTQCARSESRQSRRADHLTLLNTIIYQLLTWDDDFAREECAKVECAINTQRWQVNPLEVQKELLLRLLDELPGDHNTCDPNDRATIAPKTIILDRPDACCKNTVGGGRPEWPIGSVLLDLVEMLLGVLKESKSVVKVLIVMDAAASSAWGRPELKHIWDRLERKAEQPVKFMHRYDWEQQTREVESE